MPNEILEPPAVDTQAASVVITDTIAQQDTPNPGQLMEEFRSLLNTRNKNGEKSLILGFSILILMLLSSLLGLFRTKVVKLYRALFNDNHLRALLKEYDSGAWVFWLYYIFFFLNLGFFLFFLLKDNIQFYENRFFLLGILVGGVFLLYFFRHLVMFVIGSVFHINKETYGHSFIIMTIHCLLGLALVPINLLLAFGPPEMKTILIWLGLGLIVFGYIFRQLRGIFIASRFLQNHKFHFFLYLCTVEIAPILIVVKLLSDKIYF